MIIPKPSKEQLYNSKFILTARSNLFCSPELQEVGQLFQEYAEISLGERLLMVNSIEEAQVCFCYVDYLEGEKYVLNIGESVLTVDATTCAGAFYAVMSLRQLLDMDTTKGAELSCATMSISDEPQYQYRGLLLDIARHFFGKEDICRIIDLISAMKLNILHLHLTDDQGFRIQIDKYPKINEISSYRNGTLTRENGNSELVKERYGGYLTKDEIREIVSYAKSRYVTIIPEIDLPGHMSAVISAYPELSCTGKQIDVRERWGISKDILCAGNPDIYPFVKDILDEVCELFPSAYIHLGGDEAPKDRWHNCKKCQELKHSLKLRTEDELQSYVVNYFKQYLESKGKRVICWNDGVNDMLDKDIVSQAWSPYISKEETSRYINHGRKTIMSRFMNVYLDYPYSMTPLKKVYKYNLRYRGIKRRAQNNVLGGECCLWTEWVCNRNKIDFNLFPRICAFAETVWSKKFNYNDFKVRLKNYYKVYDAQGVNYNRKAMKSQNTFSRMSGVNKFLFNDASLEVKTQEKSFEPMSKQ